MKVLLAALGLTLLAGQAQAISRYQTMRMTCDQVQSVIAEEGAAILRWRSTSGTNLPLYGRYVSGSRFCDSSEVATFASVPTRDDRSCDVKKCERAEPDDYGRGRLFIPFGGRD